MDELEKKVKLKGSHKQRATNWELDNDDDDGNLGEGEVMSASILGQP